MEHRVIKYIQYIFLVLENRYFLSKQDIKQKHLSTAFLLTMYAVQLREKHELQYLDDTEPRFLLTLLVAQHPFSFYRSN